MSAFSFIMGVTCTLSIEFAIVIIAVVISGK